MAGIYKIRAKDTSVLPYWVDGAKLISYNNEIHLIGGWNNTQGAPNVKPFHYKSTDNGATFSSVVVMPQGGRTEGGVIVKNDKIYIYLGNDDDATSAEDVWSYDAVDGWVEVTAQWGFHVGEGYNAFAHCTHKGYAYMMLGKTRSPDVHVNKVYRSLNLVDWVDMGATIPAAMEDWEYASSVSLKGALICFGGGRIVGSPPWTINTKVFKSTDDGVTWTEIADSPLLNSSLWGDAAVGGEDTILYVSGSDTNNSTSANNRILFSYDGITWRYLHRIVDGRHATPICSHNDDVYFACGILRNDCFQLKRIN